VGDRQTLRGGIVIECFEVYNDHGTPTGKWRENARFAELTRDGRAVEVEGGTKTWA
jgi:hypothetical protein